PSTAADCRSKRLASAWLRSPPRSLKSPCSRISSPNPGVVSCAEHADLAMTVRIAMVAGETSGDLLASHLIRALRQHVPDAEFFGIGGPRMQAEGFEARWPCERLAVHGYVDALKRYRELSGIRRDLLGQILHERPDVFIGVDAPDFNLWL